MIPSRRNLYRQILFWVTTPLLAISLSLSLKAAPQARPIIDRLEFVRLADRLEVPEDIVIDMQQDNNGMLWLLTVRFLIRFDGNEFLYFSTIPAEGTDRQNEFDQRLLIDERDQIWIARGNYLSRFNISTQRFIHYPVSPDNSISSLIGVQKDKNGKLYVLTGAGRLFQFDPETEVFAGLIELPGNESVLSFFIDSRDRIWGGGDGVLYRYDVSLGKVVPAFRQEPVNPTEKSFFNVITEDRFNRIIIGSWQRHFIVYDPVSGRKQVHDILGGINDAILDNAGNLYLGTTSGLTIVNETYDQVYGYVNDKDNPWSIPAGNNWRVFIDDADNVWVGTSRSGLIVAYASTGFDNLHYSQPWRPLCPRKNNVSGLMEDSKGRLWLGYHNDGFEMLDFENNTRWYADFNQEIPDFLMLGSVYKFLELPEGVIHTSSTSSGLVIVDPAKHQIDHFNHFDGNPNSPGGSDIRDMLIDRQGNQWLMYHYGRVDWYDRKTGTFTHFLSADKPLIPGQDFWFNFLREDHSGRIWLGSSNGIAIYVDGVLDQEVLEGLPFSVSPNGNGDAVNCMLESLPGEYWIGATIGLYQYQPDKEILRLFTTDDGLPTNEVRALNSDESGKIWIATTDGLAELDPETGVINKYFKADGLPGDYVYAGATMTDSAGELYFGGRQGVFKFKPDNIQPMEKPPRVYISGFLLNNEIVPIGDPEDDSTILTQCIEETRELVLPYGPYTLTFLFSAISFKNAEQNTFSYRLDGFDNKWSDPRTRRDCTYTNLNPGEYVLQVRAANYQGVWNESAAILNIKILPPYWQTWWFRLIALTLFVVVLSLAYLRRVRSIQSHRRALQKEVSRQTVQLRRAFEESKSQQKQIARQNALLLDHQQTLEKKIDERTSELKQAKLKAEESDRIKSAFLRNISHEFRTPMNAIMGGLTVISKVQSLPDNLTHFAHMMIKGCDDLAKLVDNIVDLSRMEAGELPIEETTLDVNAFMDNIYEETRDIFGENENSEVEYILKKEKPDQSICFRSDGQRLRQIFQHLLENASKFTSAGSITLGYQTNPEKKEIVFYISDTGVGLMEDQINLVFDRFTKFYNKDFFHQGGGLGLAIVKKLIDSLGGRIDIQSKINEGTTVTLAFPQN